MTNISLRLGFPKGDVILQYKMIDSFINDLLIKFSSIKIRFLSKTPPKFQKLCIIILPL